MNYNQFSLFYELNKGRGEDAPPLVFDSLIGVFDGLHGAGAIEFTTRRGNVTTGAYEAPRLVRSVVQDYFEKNKMLFSSALKSSNDLDIMKRDLTNSIFSRIVQYADENNLSKQITVKSRMLKLLPTTMAVSYVKENKDNINILCLWAGDSRCYVLSPEKGLRQLTLDDLIMKNDAMENIINDSPMSNLIHLPLSGDTTVPYFEIHGKTYEIPKPCVVLVATDGCFGYVDSPMTFEALLLKSFETAKNVNSLGDTILKKLIGVPTSDDCTLAAISLPNILSLDDFNLLFQKRKTILYSNYINKINELKSKNKFLDTYSNNIKTIREELSSYQKTKTDEFLSMVSLKLLALINGKATTPAYKKIRCIKLFIEKQKKTEYEAELTQIENNKIYEKLLQRFAFDIQDNNNNFLIFLKSFINPFHSEIESNQRKEMLNKAGDDFKILQQYVQNILSTENFDKIKYNSVTVKNIRYLWSNVYQCLFDEASSSHFSKFPDVESRINTIKNQYKNIARDPNFKRFLDNFIDGKESSLTVSMRTKELREQYNATRKVLEEHNSLFPKKQKKEEIVKSFCVEHREEIFQEFKQMIKPTFRFFDSELKNEIVLVREICNETDRKEHQLQHLKEKIKNSEGNYISSVKSLWNSYKIVYEELLN